MKASTKQRLRVWADWILPPRVEEVVATGLGRFLMRGNARNRDLKDRHAGEARVFIVGTGPSLSSHDIRVLREERTIVPNSFYMHADSSYVNPDYCCIGDYRFMRDLPNNEIWVGLRPLPWRMVSGRPTIGSAIRPHFPTSHGPVRPHSWTFLRNSTS